MISIPNISTKLETDSNSASQFSKEECLTAKLSFQIQKSKMENMNHILDFPLQNYFQLTQYSNQSEKYSEKSTIDPELTKSTKHASDYLNN